MPGPKDGFIQKLGRFRDLWLTWHNQRPMQNPAELPMHRANVMDFLQDTPSPLFAYAILDTMQRRCNIAPSDRMMELAVKRFGPITSPVGLGYVGRYEYARSLYQAGLAADAGKQFRELHADTLKYGMLPPIDADFRAALTAKEFVGFIRSTAAELLQKKRYGLNFQLAAQMDQLGDEALCDEVLAAILSKASDKERNALTLICVQVQSQRKNFAQAEPPGGQAAHGQGAFSGYPGSYGAVARPTCHATRPEAAEIGHAAWRRRSIWNTPSCRRSSIWRASAPTIA